eukprot:5097735-Amphidinium_carterae.1
MPDMPCVSCEVSIASVQMFLEGKNVSDIAMTFMREDTWDQLIDGVHGLCWQAIEHLMLRNTSVRVFTSLLDVGQLLAYSLRAKLQNSFAWWASLPFMLPGVNGNTAQVICCTTYSSLAAFWIFVEELIADTKVYTHILILGCAYHSVCTN